MPDTTYLIAAILLAASITFALRALPFAAIEPLRSSRLAAGLSLQMPAGLMIILVVYLLRDVPSAAPTTALAAIGAALIVVGLQWWPSNALLSIFTGTAFYVLALNVLVP
jgi:branched-subunit amino acid transport protein AzlD